MAPNLFSLAFYLTDQPINHQPTTQPVSFFFFSKNSPEF